MSQAIALQSPKKSYKAKYSIEYFSRKRVPSYALWAIYLKEDSRYPRIPTAYGKTETLEQANFAVTDWCVDRGITFGDIRNDIAPWRLIKDLLDGKQPGEFFARNIKKRATENQVMEINQPVNDLVYVIDGVAYSDSRKIAERFSKRHDNVIQAIRNLPVDDFTALNFKVLFYTERGKEFPYYEVTWKGFSMLAMGFTGKAAYEWKQQFLDAFEAMGEYIYRHKHIVYANPPRDSILTDKRQAHHPMMTALIEMREKLGKETDKNHFICENKLCNAIVTGQFKTIDESTLPNEDVKLLALVRRRNQSLIDAEIPYDERKKRLVEYAIRQRTKLICV